MKRFVLISMILFIFITAVSASTVYPGENDYYKGSYKKPENVTLTSGDKVNIGVAVTCKIDNIPSTVKIGFADNIPVDFAFSTVVPDNNILSTLTLKDSDKDGKGDSAGDNVYVFYQIKSPMALTVSLGLSSLLEGESTKEKLGWSISWPSSDESGQSTTTSISYTEGTVNENHAPIFEKSISSIGYTTAGYKKLEVVTADYRQKPVDTYKGYVYVNIASNGT